jgi:hypothetical protein
LSNIPNPDPTTQAPTALPRLTLFHFKMFRIETTLSLRCHYLV